MKRTALSLLSILALAVAGGAAAQTGYDPADQPEGTVSSSAAVESPAPEPASATPTESTTTSTSGSTASGSMTETSSTSTTAHESLPATASNLPLILLVGASALGAAVAVRAYRLRRAN